jgi:signal transduction histidine kinase
MLLELEKIDHPRARRLEADVAGMAESVARLLVLARMDMMQPPELADLDITVVAGETVDRLRAWAAAQQHEIELHLGPPQILRGDSAAIREALRNLVENAVKHTPAGTRIRVEVRPDGAVVVEDSGPGIPSELAAQLFEPFRKGDPSKEGAGLGLTIVRRAVELHHGAVEVGPLVAWWSRLYAALRASRGSGASTSTT